MACLHCICKLGPNYLGQRETAWGRRVKHQTSVIPVLGLVYQPFRPGNEIGEGNDGTFYVQNANKRHINPNDRNNASYQGKPPSRVIGQSCEQARARL